MYIDIRSIRHNNDSLLHLDANISMSVCVLKDVLKRSYILVSIYPNPRLRHALLDYNAFITFIKILIYLYKRKFQDFKNANFELLNGLIKEND